MAKQKKETEDLISGLQGRTPQLSAFLSFLSLERRKERMLC
jgi:hypothetical protein